MTINDLVGKVLRPLGLAAVMYGCGGDEREERHYSPEEACRNLVACNVPFWGRDFDNCVDTLNDADDPEDYCRNDCFATTDCRKDMERYCDGLCYN